MELSGAESRLSWPTPGSSSRAHSRSSVDLPAPEPPVSATTRAKVFLDPAPELRLSRVSFRYSGHVRHALQDVTLVAPPAAASQANFDLVPIAIDECAVQTPIAIAHHHAVCFDHQHPWRWVMLACRCFVRLLNVCHRRPLLAF